MQKQQDRENSPPLRSAAAGAHEDISQYQTPLGSEGLMKLAKQRSVFIRAMRVQDVGH
jgi:hypothetical protein